MAQDYDKILKENIGNLFLVLSEKYLGLKIVKSEELKDKLQTTVEVESDFIRLIESDLGEKFILHLEFQTKDEPKMLYRMQEYYGILRRKYDLEIKQFVIYFGEKPPQMLNKLPQNEIFTGFELKNWQDYSYQTLLDSEIPEEIILALLANFGEQEPIKIIHEIILKLKQISTQEITLKRYIRQLLVLSRLRKLTLQTQNEINTMALTYNIEEDVFYQQGIENKTKYFVKKMLQKGTLKLDEIAEFAEVSLDFVKKIQEEMKKSK